MLGSVFQVLRFFFFLTEKWLWWCGDLVVVVSASVSLTLRVRLFAIKDCKTRTGSERSNTTVAVDICSRPLTHHYSALNTPCLLPSVLCRQLVFSIFFGTRICYIVQLPRILTLVYCNRCDVLATVSRLRLKKKKSFYKNVYVSVLG